MKVDVETKDVLLNKIKKYNEMYRAGTPEISDSEYDILVDKLKELDPQNEWFDKIEPVHVPTNRKVSLPIPMKSLNKAKDMAEIIKWYKSLGVTPGTKVVCMPKFDGVSLLYNECNGKAYSRGGAENEGQDCTKHLKISNIDCSKSSLILTYGEFLFSTKSWVGNFQGRISEETGEPYKSPRNTAAGLLNRDAPSNNMALATFFRYGVDPNSLKNFNTYEEVISYLCNTFHQEHLYEIITIKELSDELLMTLFQKWRKLYYIDGIVIYINDMQIWEFAGRHQTTGNPYYAIAYKHPDFTDSFETTVKGVNWKVSKSGALKPVVKIESVDTGDCNMENPTGYNAGWIDDMGIAKGAKILVTRSGGVIPKILETLAPAAEEESKSMWDELSVCPHCGQATQWNTNYVELCCTNRECSGINLAKIVFFFLICGSENIGEETFAKIFNAGYTSVKKVLDISYEQLLEIEGIGESMANVILNNNKRIRRGMDMATIMHASDCFVGIGRIKAQKLLDEMSDEDRESFYQGKWEINNPPQNPDEFDKLSKTLQAFLLGIRPFYHFIEDTGIKILPPKKEKEIIDGKYSGMSVCFSGIRDAALENEIITRGGAIVSGVSKKTTHLIVKDINGNSSKISKAKELGVLIITIEDFKLKI